MDKVFLSLVMAVFLALAGVIADSFLKVSGGGNKFVDLKLFTIGSFIYGFTILGWFYVMKYLKLSTIGVYYGVSSLLFLVLTGVFWFKEKLGVWEIVGIFLAMTSLFILGKFA